MKIVIFSISVFVEIENIVFVAISTIEINKFIKENQSYFDSFEKIVIYYDNGQETLATILDIVFATNERVERRIEFNHTKKETISSL